MPFSPQVFASLHVFIVREYWQASRAQVSLVLVAVEVVPPVVSA